MIFIKIRLILVTSVAILVEIVLDMVIHTYTCIEHNVRHHTTAYLEDVRKLENHGGKNFAFDDLIEHLYNHYLIYILICTYLYVFIIVLAFL